MTKTTVKAMQDKAQALWERMDEFFDEIRGLEQTTNVTALATMQRQLFLIGRDAVDAGCRLYSNIRIAESETTLARKP